MTFRRAAKGRLDPNQHPLNTIGNHTPLALASSHFPTAQAAKDERSELLSKGRAGGGEV